MRRMAALLVLATVMNLPSVSSGSPHPGEETFYLHCDIDLTNPAAGANFYLDVTEPDATPCGGDTNVGAPAEISIGWPAENGLPLVLDASRKINGKIELRGLYANSTLAVELIATIDGLKRTLGKTQSPAIVGPMSTYEFELPLSKSLHRAKITALSLTTTIEGTAQTVLFGLDEASSIVVPVLHSRQTPSRHNH